MANPKQKFVTQAEIQKIFNEEGYLDQVTSNAYNAAVIESKHRTPPKSKMPFCTHSQRVEYRDKKLGERIAVCHRYLMPNGKLGASGLPDPKILLHNDVVYYAKVT
jgi:hypothetical protein